MDVAIMSGEHSAVSRVNISRDYPAVTGRYATDILTKRPASEDEPENA